MRDRIVLGICDKLHVPSLFARNVPALLFSGPDLWFEEDFARIFLDMKSQKHKQIRVIANRRRGRVVKGVGHLDHV